MATAVQDHWEHFEHGADVGVRGIASTKAGAFEQAALALTAVVTDPARVQPRCAIELECRAADDELLLARWLNLVISEMASRRMLFSQFDVRLDGHRLHARAIGETVSAHRHRPAVEPKGATCTALRVAPHEDGWLAQTVVDV
jgi:tRNA nucleotidyltransferase (CCA-adding enzyme)